MSGLMVQSPAIFKNISKNILKKSKKSKNQKKKIEIKDNYISIVTCQN